MANKTMHHVVIGGDTFEIVDQYAREHGVTIDSTLAQSGQAADAKAVGDALALMYGNLTISHSETTTVAKGYYYALDNPIPKGATIIFTNTSDVQYTLALVDIDGNKMSGTVFPSGRTTQIYVERDVYQIYSYCPANATWSFSIEIMGLANNAVAFYTQSKTDEEKQTARTNIGAASAKTIADYIGYREFAPKTNNYIRGTTLGGAVSLSAATASWVYSNTPIYVRKGETIHCKTRANGMCTIATAPTNDFSGAVCRAAANDDTSIKEYQYIAENNCYAWVSGRVNETSAYVDYASLYSIGTNIGAAGKQTYTVRKNGSGDFTTFTGALNALKNDVGEKTIYVYPGTYDIFEEMGGAEYIQSITSPTSLNWKDVNAIVSDNTEIIGIGNVILSYEPEDSEIISNDHAFLFAALNIPAVSCKVENITVKAKNCRYAVHIENGTAENKIDLLFENVRVYMGQGGIRNPQAVGTGIGNNVTWKFKNCLFHNETNGGCFTSHTNVPIAGDSTSIVFEGCCFTVTGQTESGAINVVQLISAYNTTPENVTNYARFISCYATGKLALVNGYDSRPVTKKQLFDFTAINCVCGGIFTSSSFEDSEPVSRY